MSRPSGITCAAVLALMAKPNNRLLTLEQLGAQLGVTDSGAWYHVKKLLETGDVIVAKKGGFYPTQYSLAVMPVRYEGEIAPPMQVNRYTKPLSGYERSLRDAASLALAGRA